MVNQPRLVLGSVHISRGLCCEKSELEGGTDSAGQEDAEELKKKIPLPLY